LRAPNEKILSIKLWFGQWRGSGNSHCLSCFWRESLSSSFRQFARSTHEGVGSVVKTSISSSVAILVVTSWFARTVLADLKVEQAPKRKQKVEEHTVVVKGSIIPLRVSAEPIGT